MLIIGQKNPASKPAKTSMLIIGREPQVSPSPTRLIQNAESFNSLPRLHTLFNDGDWRGNSCFLIGGGASLKDFDWNRLKGQLTIGTNRVFEKYYPTINISMDARLWSWITNGTLGEYVKQRYDQYTGIKVWRPNTGIGGGNTYFLDGNVGTITKSLIDGCTTGNNTGFFALNLAILLGANPIYLLGYDMRGDNTGKQVWFHDGYPHNQGSGVYDKFIANFECAFPEIEASGTRVVNLNSDSGLKCFEFGNVDDVLPATAPKIPLYVSFYTPDYTPFVAEFLESAKKFGVETYIEEISWENNTWQSVTHKKATFISSMMEKFPDRDICWVDIDARFKSNPVIFNNFPGDVGVCIVDWQKYGRNNKMKEMLSGTLYLKNTSEVKCFVKTWIHENENNPSVWEQKNLHIILDKWRKKLNVVEIPDTYCQIFDLMADAGKPVILHTQASRIMRGRK